MRPGQCLDINNIWSPWFPFEAPGSQQTTAPVVSVSLSRVTYPTSQTHRNWKVKVNFQTNTNSKLSRTKTVCEKCCSDSSQLTIAGCDSRVLLTASPATQHWTQLPNQWTHSCAHNTARSSTIQPRAASDENRNQVLPERDLNSRYIRLFVTKSIALHLSTSIDNTQLQYH